MNPNQNFDLNSMFNFMMQNPQFANLFPNPNTPNPNSPIPNFPNPNFSSPNFSYPNIPNPNFRTLNTSQQDPLTPASNTGSNSETQGLENIDTCIPTAAAADAAPVPARTATGRKGRKNVSTSSRRNVNAWSVADDKLLASAYLNVSKDPIVGINQPASTYWQRFTDFYNQNRNENEQVERELNSCKQHWYLINALCNKFKGCYAKFEGRSGFNEARIMTEALELFEAINNGKFPYEHVWYCVKDEPKWRDECIQKNDTKRMKVSEDGSYTSSGANVNDEEEVQEVRPMGQKAAKKLEFDKRKGKNVRSIQDCETANILQQVEESRITTAQIFAKAREDELKVREGELKAQEEALEVQLACADITKMSSIQRKFHELKMKELALKKGWTIEEEY